jgi:hypothetical protein
MARVVFTLFGADEKEAMRIATTRRISLALLFDSEIFRTRKYAPKTQYRLYL